MDREKLKTVAGCYFKEHIGGEPDVLGFTYADDGVREYTLEAVFGGRLFEIHMLPLHNRIRLTEKKNLGTFADAAALAGMDRNLDNL